MSWPEQEAWSCAQIPICLCIPRMQVFERASYQQPGNEGSNKSRLSNKSNNSNKRRLVHPAVPNTGFLSRCGSGRS